MIHMSRDMSEKNRARTNVGPVIGRPRKPRSVADPRSNRASAQVSVPATLEGSGHQSTSHAGETHVSPSPDHNKSPETRSSLPLHLLFTLSHSLLSTVTARPRAVPLAVLVCTT